MSVERCPVVQGVLDRALADLRTTDGSRHETARDSVRALVALGGEGHHGVKSAVEQVSRVFAEAVGPERIANGEWHRLLIGAVKLAATKNPSPRQSCPDDRPTSVEAPAGFHEALVATQQRIEVERQQAAEMAAEVYRDRAREMIKEVGDLPFAERAEAVRRLIPEIAGWGAAEQSYARDELSSKHGLTDLGVTEFRALLRAEEKARKAAADEAAHELARQRAAEQVERARGEGRLLPPPHAPIDVARELAGRMTIPAKWWRGDFYRWTGTRYVVWRDEAVDNWLYGQTADAWFDAGEEKGTSPWRPTETKITSVSHALSRGVLYHPSDLEPDDAPTQVACANGVYDVVSSALLPHTPERFNLQAVPFDFDPAATCPAWVKFLDDVLPRDAQTFLGEWFGYILSGRTDLEKIANLVGPPRSGKGTIATILEALIGGENVASPSMPSLVGTFGEQPLVGKTLAVFSDISWSHRDVVAGVEILKAISGQDTRDVNRKNREAWHGRLGVRFTIMGNDMPRFTDASGALAGRMVHVQFSRTFAGREDPTLKQRLLAELPGILNWALAHLRTLTEQGKFSVPQTSEDLAAEVRRQQSPIQGFLDDVCVRMEGRDLTPLDALYPVYKAWAKDADVDRPLDRERFSRALSSAGLQVERKMINGVRARRIHGIAPQIDSEGRSKWVTLINPDALAPVTPPEGF